MTSLPYFVYQPMLLVMSASVPCQTGVKVVQTCPVSDRSEPVRRPVAVTDAPFSPPDAVSDPVRPSAPAPERARVVSVALPPPGPQFSAPSAVPVSLPIVSASLLTMRARSVPSGFFAVTPSATSPALKVGTPPKVGVPATVPLIVGLLIVGDVMPGVLNVPLVTDAPVATTVPVTVALLMVGLFRVLLLRV